MSNFMIVWSLQTKHKVSFDVGKTNTGDRNNHYVDQEMCQNKNGMFHNWGVGTKI